MIVISRLHASTFFPTTIFFAIASFPNSSPFRPIITCHECLSFTYLLSFSSFSLSIQVLEQFQRESSSRLSAENRRFEAELAASRGRESAAEAKTKKAEAKIEELEAAVAAAKRLNEQIIKKEMIVAETKKKLEERDQQLKNTVIALGLIKCSFISQFRGADSVR